MRLFVALAAVVIAAATAHAAEWGTVNPGETTQSGVREQFGAPTKMTTNKVEGYDSAQWLYEGAQAPAGLTRMVLDFGLLTPKGYRPEIVRVMRLEPHRGVFTHATVLNGWGAPQRVGDDKGQEVMFYEVGLFVYFDKDGDSANTLLFTPPQKPVEAAEPRRP